MVLLSPLIAPVMIFTIGPLATYVATPARFGELAAAAWLAVLWRDHVGWSLLQPQLRKVAIATGCILLLERTVLPSLVFVEPSIALLLSGACVGLAVSQSGNGHLQQLMNSCLLRWFGKYSYGIYVYHHALKPIWIHSLW
jgi:peptidoglycan/LPS O-acetylase OafA/YrhL